MSLVLVNVDSRVEVVCSKDPAVTMKLLPARPLTDEERAAGHPAPQPERENRRPSRWLTRDEVESIGPDALRLTYRPINCDEQWTATGGAGIGSLSGATYARACYEAYKIGLVSAQGPGVSVANANELAAFRSRLPLTYAEDLGARILDESLGLRDPFVESA